MPLFNALQRAIICDTQLSCAECKKCKVKSGCINTGMIFMQPGFIYKNYRTDNEATTIVFALCRKCCDKYTLTKLRWKWAEWQWKWNQFVWVLTRLIRHMYRLK